MKHLTGRLEIVDSRDNNYPFSKAGPLETSEGVTKYWHTGTPLNQQSTPQCVAFAWKQLLQSSPYTQGEKLRESFVYELAQERDAWQGENYDGTSVRAGAKVLQKLGFLENYIWARTAQDMKDWVTANSPLVLGTRWHRGMSSPNAEGYVSVAGGAIGGHAYLCTGYSHKRNAFRCMNSWGKEWGQKGKFWINFEDMETLLKDYGECCAAVEVPLGS